MKRWIQTKADSAIVELLTRTTGIPTPVAHVLALRGVADVTAAERFLHPRLADLHNPLLLRDMDVAVDRLLAAIRSRTPIEIHGDYDVDGTTSTIILKTAIEMAGGVAGFWIPHRINDGYGLRDGAMEAAAAKGVKLVVSVDTGIRAKAAVEHARSLGLDVIVTDHHLPEAELPRAAAVVNPKRPDCFYPEKNLCGAGVAFKLAQALLGRLGWPQEKLDRVLASLLKLVAIATVADVVPLTGENRLIVAHGLRGLANVRNPGLRALLDVSGVASGRAPTASQIGFRVAPRINAAGRMASAAEVIELFLTSDASRARDIAERLSALNSERQDEESRILELILEECEGSEIDITSPALVFAGENWHRGVLGIVASRLVERFTRPCFVLGMQNGEAAGSGRSIPAFHLLEGLESMRTLFIKFGGHRQAAGATLPSDNILEFRRMLADYAGSVLNPEDFEPTQHIDSPLRLPEIGDALWAALQKLEPFGMGNPTPVFAASDVEVMNEPTVIKEKHVRFCAGQDGRILPLTAFRAIDRIEELRRGSRIDVAFRIESDDYWGGWSAKICDFRPCVN